MALQGDGALGQPGPARTGGTWKVKASSGVGGRRLEGRASVGCGRGEAYFKDHLERCFKFNFKKCASFCRRIPAPVAVLVPLESATRWPR